MKKPILLICLMLLCGQLHSCDKNDTPTHGTATVNLRFRADGQITVTDGLVMVFDSRGTLYSLCNAPQGKIEDLSPCVSIPAGRYTALVLMNCSGYQVSPAPVAGETDISALSVVPNRQAEPERLNPFLWFGIRTFEASPETPEIVISKVSSMGMGVTVNPWQCREEDVELKIKRQ